jgi:glycosyltransferase involved in cell wall biosynthesis
MANIGIVIFSSSIGSGGGTDVYSRFLLEYLADYGVKHKYFALVNASTTDTWNFRSWPSHIQFTLIHETEPTKPAWTRMQRQIRRLLRLPISPHYGDVYIARQIDALGLDLLHYPRTIIRPLMVNTPCVLTFFDMQHEYYPQFFTRKELSYRAEIYGSSVEKCRHIIVPSDFTRKTLIEKYGVGIEKTTCIPVGIAEKFCRVEDVSVQRVKRKYALPDSFIFYPANPWQHKNHMRLMAALRIYRDCYGTLPWLVTSGRLYNERRDVISLAIAAGVEEKVLDLGFIPLEDLPALYSAATLLVFPSLFEGFGIPLVEAMACGCPIVAADATAIPEITSGAALLFDPLNPESIALAIHNLIVDKDLSKILVERGYKRLNEFKWEKLIPQIEEVYGRVVSDVSAK